MRAGAGAPDDARARNVLAIPRVAGREACERVNNGEKKACGPHTFSVMRKRLSARAHGCGGAVGSIPTRVGMLLDSECRLCAR